MRLVLLSMILSVMSLTAYAADTQVALALCPQDGRNTIEAFHTDRIKVGESSVTLTGGKESSEPLFSSEIQWMSNGDIFLVRKNKAAILLGSGERPDLRSTCGVFKFDLDKDTELSLKSKHGLPFPHCGDTGCVIVRPSTETLTIKNADEVIVYVGHSG